jgi:hypothetical protein
MPTTDGEDGLKVVIALRVVTALAAITQFKSSVLCPAQELIFINSFLIPA